MHDETIGVVGAGVMGAEIALVAALKGFGVVLRDMERRRVADGLEHARKAGERMVRKGRVGAHDLDRRLAHIVPAVDSRPLRDCGLVIEAVTERMDVKRSVFRELGRELPHDAIIASNTSGLSITELGRASGRPRHVLGLHFFNPPSVMRLVEVIRGEETSSGTMARALAVVRAMDKTPVTVRECPGFLVNRILVRAMCHAYREAQRVDADLAGVDAEVVAHGPAPMGPFELGDLVGLDTMAHIRDDLDAAYEGRFADDGVLHNYVNAGFLGRKTGRGFFEGPVTTRPHVDSEERLVARGFYEAACDEARRCVAESVASARDVDTAMRLGAGWAHGPLS